MRKLKLEELGRTSVAAFKQQPKAPLVIILDNVRSALNVGSAFRTADAFALEHVYLCGITAQPPHREILKTAIGATESVDWTYAPDIVTLVDTLRTQGWRVFAVEQAEGSISLDQYQVRTTDKTALIFGNEVEGVSDAVMPLVDGAVEVPQWGTKHSLNIAVCIGVVVWEMVRQWRSLQQK
ncbi:MAG: RNA methyltransferase [Lewinellaceae bacterium]|nr:RNA methyltransferase [Lewinellaceae bacterium]